MDFLQFADDAGLGFGIGAALFGKLASCSKMN
jgi:hypothetical protein